MNAPLIELDRVCVIRGNNAILNDVSLSIRMGEHCAILGPNGSGKSTLLKLLTRATYPSYVDGIAGTVRILGDTEWNVWDLRTQLGIVSAELDTHFTAGRSGRLTALQAVLTGFFASELEPDADRITDTMETAAHLALELFEMDGLSHRVLGTLSTGERRRVMLARAMVRQPKAIVLDEPTTGLDVRAQRQLLVSLSRLAQLGTTLLLVTHHFEEILPCIDRIVLMKDGRIDFDGPPVQALNRDRIQWVYDCDVDIRRDRDGFYRMALST